MIPIKGVEKTSLIDYPGKISAVVFLGGCNFRCPFCHNRELVLDHENLDSIPEEEVLRFLESRREWLDGVVISGGEPTLYKELPGFLEKVKGLGYLVKVDTNGTNPGMLKGLMEKGLVDYIAMDIKGPMEKYQNVAGVSADTERIKESISLVISSDLQHEFRSTILPGLHTKDDVVAMAKMLAGAEKFYLQQFRPRNTLDPELNKAKPFEEKEMRELRDLCREHVETEVRMS
jgi:pyruvate formate lyase activating enzyme